MIIRKLDALAGTEAVVEGETWISRRLLLARDGMGFSMHDTIIKAGTTSRFWYRNHLEAVFCIEGRGSVEDLATGEVHPIEAGTLYALDQHDRHILRAETDMRMICVFDPPLVGPETHDENGVYPLLTEPTAATGK